MMVTEYHCSKRQGVIRQLRGTLVISATHITFEPLEILKQEVRCCESISSLRHNAVRLKHDAYRSKKTLCWSFLLSKII